MLKAQIGGAVMERTNGKEKIVKAGLLAVLLLFAAPAFVFPLVGSGVGGKQWGGCACQPDKGFQDWLV